jgi:hypothetical protein
MTVAALIGAGVVSPDLVDAWTHRLQDVLPDARRTAETGSAVQWSGTVAAPRGEKDPIPVEVFLYKAQKRIRINIQSSTIATPEADHISDAIASAFDASVVMRSYADAAASEPSSRVRPSGTARPVPTTQATPRQA